MPHSLVLNLVPQTPIYPNFLTGRHYHALFLTLVTAVDRDLGDRLHGDTGNKAFTLSPFQIIGDKPRKKYGQLQCQHYRAIAPGTPCWWRISLLDDTLFARLTALWLQLDFKKSWHLGSANLHLTSILGTPQTAQPWANAASYLQLYENASEQEREFSFYFATPTAFRQGSQDTAMPEADRVFQSLLRQWNKRSSMPFSHLTFEDLFPSSFDICTECVVDSRSKFVGCRGKVTYRSFGNSTSEHIKQLNTLADFALYCGIGRKTTMGMGMVRRLVNSH
ncbi:MULTISPECIES: CRISPR-associated endoribonuclease Cas6 [Spirulina sp. CCY15215]|uniref:CRISPR-associated endoribonuclease Cas6 n=1 Tax=Spirulina sp. CCY15215 TaxID=2767591 RepID=UPI0019524DD8|nr:CRISPR-associated endoribonuclease Cas6 [Spirulina major]